MHHRHRHHHIKDSDDSDRSLDRPETRVGNWYVNESEKIVEKERDDLVAFANTKLQLVVQVAFVATMGAVTNACVIQ
jgi:hypothetical protein